jgi:cysteinyl-tRNA synthetase
MEHNLFIYNSLSRDKVRFQPLNSPFVGLYVCGPTVYSASHLGHARPFITFDILFRYLQYLGYKVRYVRNITDVGHLENEVTEEGEDRIAKKAHLENLEPMELVQNYIRSFRSDMDKLNILPPSIEPQASGHIIEQQVLIEKILKNGYAYENNGSVYFDIEEYNKNYKYGRLSGRVLDELLENTRKLEGSKEKRNSFDFALWKKASADHIMHWPSAWSEGFPGWHLECSAMSVKYLGKKFDIHGGGMDLMFPHHECEIAQNVAAEGEESVTYWMHNNMITINGQKMARSLGNFITLNELFTGTHKLLSQAYTPMTIRFFILQAHYRSTLDFSDEALKAAEKGLSKIFSAMKILPKLKAANSSEKNDMIALMDKIISAMNDDLSTPQAIAHIFEGVRLINSVNDGHESITASELTGLKEIFSTFVIDILGLKPEETKLTEDQLDEKLIGLLIHMRLEAKNKKDFSTSDAIRDQLLSLGIILKDTKEGTTWEKN